MNYIRRPLTIPNSSPASALLQGGKAGSKDPRNVPVGNAPFAQPDMVQFSTLRQQLQNVPPIQYSSAQNDAPAPDYSVRTTATRLQAITWLVTITTINVPVLLMPKNLARLGLDVVNNNSANILFYSWGRPTSNAGGTPIGNGLMQGQRLPDFGGFCPVDDLWVWWETGLPPWGQNGFEMFECLEAQQ